MGWVFVIAVIFFFFLYLIGRSGSGHQRETLRSRSSVQQRPPRREVKSKVGAAKESRAAWVSPGEPVSVAGRTIPDGMIYVGRAMESLRGYSDDPALIRPDLRVGGRDMRLDHQGSELSYWPSYSQISPVARATYLEWLSTGRRNPGFDVGYVFLFFYGLERRVLLDAQLDEEAKSDLQSIEREVELLLDVYGDSQSFRGYARNLLEVLRLTTTGLNTDTYDPPITNEGYDLPLGLKLGLGAMIGEGEPIPARWALSWVRCHPSTDWRTPGRRCADEFNELFQLRYADRYGQGIRVKPPKTRLSMEYRPASNSFPGPASLEGADVPDVGRLKAPLRNLQKLVDDTQDALDSYSRYMGRNDDKSSPEALAHLPAELVTPDRLEGDAEALVSAIERELGDRDGGFIPISLLIRWWPTEVSTKLRKGEARDLANFLESVGFGIEPDPRYGSPNPGQSERAVVYRLNGLRGEPSGKYRAATVLLHLGAALAAADDEVTIEEEQHLERHLEQGLDLSERDRLRLRAHLEWLLAEPPSLRGLRRRVRHLDEETRRRMALFLIAIAGADGKVSGGEVEILGKLYPILGLPEDEVYTDLHSFSTGEERGPVTVLRPQQETEDFAVPAEGRKKTERVSKTIYLDENKLKRIRDDSAKAGELLEEIFRGDDEEDFSEIQQEDSDVDGEPDSLFVLNSSYMSLLRDLRTHDRWKWDQFEDLTEEHGLLARGAIEILNEAAFQACGEPLLEGETEVHINAYALEAMLE